MEMLALPNISKDRLFLNDLEDRSTRFIVEIKMFLEMVKKRINIEKFYYEQMSSLVPTELMDKDCSVKCLVLPLIDGIQKKINEKEFFIQAVNSQDFIDLKESVVQAEHEIVHLRKKSSQNINELNKIENMILVGQKDYWNISKGMEEAIHKFVCLADEASKKERKTLFATMEERVKKK